MPVNRVDYFGETLIDISDSTVTAETLPKGMIGYDKAGNRVEGLAETGGGGNIHVGTEPPTDPNIDVWIDPSGEASEILPQVTAADNGKFLRVVNGNWAAQTVPDAEGVGF